MGGKEEGILSFRSPGNPQRETGGADVEEEPFYSRPVSGGVFGH